MATLHEYMATLEKISITPGSYVALWSENIDHKMPESDSGILGRKSFELYGQVAPTLMYTPDGVTLQDRTTGAVRGTLTQYKQAQNYMWRYSSHTNPKSAAHVLRVWVIDPMPEAEALTLARETYQTLTAKARFNNYRCNSASRELTRMLFGFDVPGVIIAEDNMGKILLQVHKYRGDGTEPMGQAEAYREFVKATRYALDNLGRKLSGQYDRAAKALAALPPRGDSSYESDTQAGLGGLGYAVAVSQVLKKKAPTLRRYATITAKKTTTEILEDAYQKATRAMENSKKRMTATAILNFKPAPTIH